jgi:hypothetical protein
MVLFTDPLTVLWATSLIGVGIGVLGLGCLVAEVVLGTLFGLTRLAGLGLLWLAAVVLP